MRSPACRSMRVLSQAMISATSASVVGGFQVGLSDETRHGRSASRAASAGAARPAPGQSALLGTRVVAVGDPTAAAARATPRGSVLARHALDSPHALRPLRRPPPHPADRPRLRPQEVAPVAEELDREKRFPYEIVEKLGELGLMGIPFPEEYGGAGGDSLAYALAVEELTRVDSSVAITMCAHTSLGTQPIYLFGSEEQKQRYLPGPVRGAQARRVRADRARGGLRRRQHEDARAARGRRLGRSTAPSSSSPTPGRTSPGTSRSRR